MSAMSAMSSSACRSAALGFRDRDGRRDDSEVAGGAATAAARLGTRIVPADWLLLPPPPLHTLSNATGRRSFSFSAGCAPARGFPARGGARVPPTLSPPRNVTSTLPVCGMLGPWLALRPSCRRDPSLWARSWSFPARTPDDGAEPSRDGEAVEAAKMTEVCPAAPPASPASARDSCRRAATACRADNDFVLDRPRGSMCGEWQSGEPELGSTCQSCKA